MLKLERFNVVVLEMTFSLHWAVGVGQKITFLRFEMRQNEFLDHQVLSALLLNRVFLALVNMIIAFNN